jgi:hypothetical protein
MFEKSLTMYQISLDPPKSTPLATLRERLQRISRETRPTQWLPFKRGTLILIPPFLRLGGI